MKDLIQLLEQNSEYRSILDVEEVSWTSYKRINHK